MSKPKLNPGHYLEITDRIHVTMCMVNDHLIQHPVCKIEKEVSNKVDEALNLLFDAYQIAGNLMHEKTNT